MTREDAIRLVTNCTINSYDYQNLKMAVDKIYDDFESRTCKNCKHGGNCSIQYSATIDFAKEPNNFSCEAWEPKQ